MIQLYNNNVEYTTILRNKRSKIYKNGTLQGWYSLYILTFFILSCEYYGVARASCPD